MSSDCGIASQLREIARSWRNITPRLSSVWKAQWETSYKQEKEICDSDAKFNTQRLLLLCWKQVVADFFFSSDSTPTAGFCLNSFYQLRFSRQRCETLHTSAFRSKRHISGNSSRGDKCQGGFHHASVNLQQVCKKRPGRHPLTTALSRESRRRRFDLIWTSSVQLGKCRLENKQADATTN